MMKSMTGYGKGEITCGSKKISVEIRSLNSKQVDLSVKSPSIYRQSEYEIRSMVSKRLLRGKMDLFISYEESGEQSSRQLINSSAFSAYCTQLKTLAKESGLGWESAQMDASLVSTILRLPDVVQSETQTLSEEEKAALMACVGEALDRIEAFREQEGAKLMNDLLERIDTLERLKDEVTPYEKARTETIRKRILDHAEKINLSVDASRLEQEMIFYLEKLDITEEKVRLQNHCDYFREVAHQEVGAGRKLGFIAQELGREINTLGSKSNEAEMQKIVVRMKDELEKIKEQLLNIL